MRNKRGIIISILSFAAAGAVFGNSVYRDVIASKRDPKPEEESKDSLWLREHDRKKDVYLNAVDMLRLYSLWLMAEDSHEYVIVLRDIRQSVSDAAPYVRHYAEAGRHVLVPDLRGCGQSEGGYYGYGYDDRLDVLSWVHWILRRDPKARILLHGLGAGANACLLAGAEHMPPTVYAIVSDSAFTSLRAHLIHALDETNSVVPLFLRLFLLRVVTRALAGYDIYAISPMQAVKNLSVPTLFLHGDTDRQVPVEMCRKLYEEARCTRQIGVFLGAGHLEAEKTQTERYWKQADTFVAKQHPKRL